MRCSDWSLVVCSSDLVDLPVPGPEGGERTTHMDLVAIVRDDPHVSEQALRPGMRKFRMRGALLQSLNPLLHQERVVGGDRKCGLRRRVRTSDGGGHQKATFRGNKLLPAVQLPGTHKLTLA